MRAPSARITRPERWQAGRDRVRLRAWSCTIRRERVHRVQHYVEVRLGASYFPVPGGDGVEPLAGWISLSVALLRENSGYLRALRDMLKLQAGPVMTRGCLSRFRVIKLKGHGPIR